MMTLWIPIIYTTEGYDMVGLSYLGRRRCGTTPARIKSKSYIIEVVKFLHGYYGKGSKTVFYDFLKNYKDFGI